MELRRGIARSFFFSRQVWFGQGRGVLALRELVSKLHVFCQHTCLARRRRRKTKKKQDNKLVFQILSFLVSFKFFVHSLNSLGLRDCYSRSKKVGGYIYIRELRSSQGEGKGRELMRERERGGFGRKGEATKGEKKNQQIRLAGRPLPDRQITKVASVGCQLAFPFCPPN
jgi:hypothetical protein